LPALASSVLADGTAVDLSERYRFAEQLVTTGRGYAYPTAREAALKLMETSYLAALSFSGADLLHGPVALADADVPVIAVVGAGPAGESMHDVLATVSGRRADLVVVGPRKVPGALHVPTPEVDERHAPLLDILPLQRMALALSLARGENPDTPRALRKVTTTL
jgi:glucosamine--fructose-6-phosphate aminotransferase (isomerizing)